MSTEKLCPLNNMEPCVGKKCAWYLSDTAAIAAQGNLSAMAGFEDVSAVSCAINITAFTTLQLCANIQLDTLVRQK